MACFIWFVSLEINLFANKTKRSSRKKRKKEFVPSEIRTRAAPTARPHTTTRLQRLYGRSGKKNSLWLDEIRLIVM